MISGYPRSFADSVGLRRLLITDKSVKDAAAKQYAATALTDFFIESNAYSVFWSGSLQPAALYLEGLRIHLYGHVIQMPDLIYILLDGSVRCELAAACSIQQCAIFAQPSSSR